MSERDPYDIRHLIIAVAVNPSDVRTNDHRCGVCSWQGSGRVDCPNNRKVVVMWPDDIDGVDRDTDQFLERADEAREAEMDRELGADPWSR